MANFIPKLVYTPLAGGSPVSITMDYPPSNDPLNEEYDYIRDVARSSSGVQQVQWNYTLKSYKVKFQFQSVTTMGYINTFMLEMMKGNTFNYYIHSDVASYETFTIVGKSFKLNRVVPNGSGDFLYDFEFEMEKVV